MAAGQFQGRSVPSSRRISVVGEARYQDALSEIAGGKSPDGRTITTNAEIRREPANRFDTNVIQVLIAWRVVGYLSRGDAAEYAPALDRAQLAGVPCPAEIRGGWLPEPSELASGGE